MSFGGGGFGGGNSTFGGFGSSNTGGGFGANNNTSSGSSLFGGNTATSGGFGTGGGFGASNQSNSFGASKPSGFGASTATTSGGGLFGGGATTSTSGGFGGFGATNNNASGGFGASNSGGGLFGQNKPATGGFGASNTSGGGGLFGGGASTGGGFGASNTTGGFGATNNTSTGGFGANTNNNTGGGFAFGGASSTPGSNSNNGTAGTPFNAFPEKEGNTNATSYYQSVTFQPAYQAKSFEELRLEDYNQGRRFGNSNGQAGAFGQSTGFGGFGASNNATSNTGGGLFGNNNTTNTATNTANTGFGGFGASNNNTSTGAFGSTNNNTGGGLFGAQQNKPAGGGLFGNTTQTSGATTGGFGSTTGISGGLFGNTSGGFGSNNNTQQSGGLFGNNSNQQQQNKPAFGGFGASTTNNQSTGFGANNSSGGGLFGNTNNQQSGGGLFGSNNNNQQQQQSGTGFGASTNTGGGLFGAANNKPAGGLFGNTNNTSSTTGGGLFGNTSNQQQQSGGGLFGNSTNNNTSGGGLFGNQNQNKPAGTGLFGSSANTGGSLFGNNNNNQQQQQNTGFGGSTGGSLFGNQNKPAGNSLFGNSTNNNTSNTGGGLSLFGNSTNQQQNNSGSSLFGGNNQNQNQQNNSGSLFGGSFGGNNQQQPQQNQLHASLTGAPYGNEQLFSSLAAPSPPVGPLATPLTGARPPPRKTPSLLASARLNNTPTYSPTSRALARGSYGFNYSTYGTPGSAFTSGSLTPGASSLLRPTGSLSSGLASRLSKSSSMSNLRGESPADGRSLLRPGVFSPPGTSTLGRSNVRKLNIDRSVRTDLFGPVEEDKTIESRERAGGERNGRAGMERTPALEPVAPVNGQSSSALVRTETEDDQEATPRQYESARSALSTVPEDRETSRPASAPNTERPSAKSVGRDEIGEYWTKPPMKDLKKFTRQQLKNVGNFVVGRDGVGSIEFGSVDLTNTPIEDICGTIVQLNPRSATVYQDDTNKPAMGKALNVPSTIHLEKSWPRSHGGKKAVSAKSGPEYEKHIRRLKRVGGTKFENYNPDTGVWTFTVEHFTTYGLDDDDDDETEAEIDDSHAQQGDSSGLSDAPETPTGEQELEMEEVETPTGEMDDTFQFKLDRRSQISVPGGFGSEGPSYDHDDHSAGEDMEDDQYRMSGGLGQPDMEDPFTSPGGAVQAPSPGAMDRYHSSMMEDEAEDEPEDVSQEIPGAFTEEPKMPKSILKPTAALSAFAYPEKLATETWEEQLQRTLSPKKRDRQALRDMQQSFFRAQEDDVAESPFKKSMMGQSALGQSYLAQKSAKKSQAQPSLLDKSQLGQSRAFTSAKDIMDSLWSQEKPGRKAAAGAKGFELPYPKRRRISSDDLRPNDLEWHDTMKTHFTDVKGTMVYAVPGAAPQIDAPFEPAMNPLVGAHKDVRFARFKPAGNADTATLDAQKSITVIDDEDEFPAAKVPAMVFYTLSQAADTSSMAGKRERWIWKICSIFLDPLAGAVGEIVDAVPDFSRLELEAQMRMDALGDFWALEVVAAEAAASVTKARSAEEKALAMLTRNDVAGACEVLAEARDFKLAMTVSQLPGSEHSRSVMRSQIEAWRQRNDWSEMSDAVRALYSILAGNVCNVEGKTGAPENRAEGFGIAERFGLSWRQSFALRLYFGGFHHASDAIQAYGRDLVDGLESIIPSMHWIDGTVTGDALIEILMLLAGSADPSKVFDPMVMAGSAFDTRLTWQVASIFNASGKCPVPTEQMDQITVNFTSEVEAQGNLMTAAWALLHLDEAAARERAVRALLERNAEVITLGSAEVDAETVLYELTEGPRIPSQLIHRVRALYAAGNGDAASQTLSLIFAGDVEEAHEVVCSVVGPNAVISQDYDTLATLLAHFENVAQRPQNWAKGGQVLADFLRVAKGRSSGAVVQRLGKAVRGMEVRGRGLEERVAVGEMRRVVEGLEGESGEGDVEMGGQESGNGEGEADGVRMLEAYRAAMGVVG